MSASSRIFILGTSAGGVTAIHRLLEELSTKVTAPMIVVQHLPDLKHVDVKTVYPAGAGRNVLEVEDKMPVEEGHVYFAPGGYHLLIEKDGCFSLTQDEPVRYSRPSIDLSFESAARAFGPRLVAVLLTGANSDGAEGMLAVRKEGGVCIVQNPEEAEFPEMPEAAIKMQKPDHVTSLRDLPGLLLKLQNEAVS